MGSPPLPDTYPEPFRDVYRYAAAVTDAADGPDLVMTAPGQRSEIVYGRGDTAVRVHRTGNTPVNDAETRGLLIGMEHSGSDYSRQREFYDVPVVLIDERAAGPEEGLRGGPESLVRDFCGQITSDGRRERFNRPHSPLELAPTRPARENVWAALIPDPDAYDDVGDRLFIAGTSIAGSGFNLAASGWRQRGIAVLENGGTAPLTHLDGYRLRTAGRRVDGDGGLDVQAERDPRFTATSGRYTPPDPPSGPHTGRGDARRMDGTAHADEVTEAYLVALSLEDGGESGDSAGD